MARKLQSLGISENWWTKGIEAADFQFDVDTDNSLQFLDAQRFSIEWSYLGKNLTVALLLIPKKKKNVTSYRMYLHVLFNCVCL